tara:strand:+ start:12858 stop:14132 length:1275 start_codon:yes stop_codon:yes gene_type:complete
MADPNENLDPEPVDAEFEPAIDRPAGERSSPRRSGVGIGTVGLLFFAATLAGGGLGFIAARYVPTVSTEASTDDSGAADERAALTDAITGLETRLAAMEASDPAAAARAATDEPLAALAQRLERLEAAGTARDSAQGEPVDLSAIEARLGAAETSMAALDARLDTAIETGTDTAGPAVDPLILQNLTERIAALENIADTAPTDTASQDALLAVQAELDALQTALAETRIIADDAQATALSASEAAASSAAAQPTDTGQASRQLAARALALSALRDIAGTHESFEAERAALAQLWRGNGDLAAMSSYARAGVPTVDDLTADYPGDAIRDAAGPGRIFFGLIEVRQTASGSGDTGAMAITALAEDRLATRDLAGAVTLTEQLDETSLAAAQDWLLSAQARLDLDRRLVTLRQALTEMAATQGEDPQ